jgi:hypothetical protein
LEYFCQNLTASKTAQILGINRKKVDKYYNLFRALIFQNQLKQKFKRFDGEIKFADELKRVE